MVVFKKAGALFGKNFFLLKRGAPGGGGVHYYEY